jgi:hypothetical protein
MMSTGSTGSTGSASMSLASEGDSNRLLVSMSGASSMHSMHSSSSSSSYSSIASSGNDTGGISDSIASSGASGDGNGSGLMLATFPFMSQCEHHMLPFYGTVHIACYRTAAASNAALGCDEPALQNVVPGTLVGGAGPQQYISRKDLEYIVQMYTQRLQVPPYGLSNNYSLCLEKKL